MTLFVSLDLSLDVHRLESGFLCERRGGIYGSEEIVEVEISVLLHDVDLRAQTPIRVVIGNHEVDCVVATQIHIGIVQILLYDVKAINSGHECIISINSKVSAGIPRHPSF
jgi:hypothetical protein